MRDVDTIILENLYKELLNPTETIEENLILKRKRMDDGKFIFVVDSDMPDSAGRNETFKKKTGIRDTGLFYFDKANLRRWVSKDSFEESDFHKAAPTYKKAVMSLNKSSGSSPINLDDASEEIEELADLGAQDQIENFLSRLKKELEENINSPEIQDFLNFRKKFRNYSFNNQMLIYLQRKDATHVAGRVKWEKEFGRKLKKGSKGIQIFIPIIVKDKPEDGHVPAPDDEVRKITRFKLGPIFDISDTEPIEGKEDIAKIPEKPKWYSDENLDETTESIFEALSSFAEMKNIKVKIGSEGLGDARGVSSVGSIQLLQKNISTMVHEIAHELIHTMEIRMRGEIPSNIKELQAEGVAYVVLEEFGLSSEHAAKYLALWKIDPEHITQNQDVIRKTANEIIDYVYGFVHKQPEQTGPVKENFDYLFRLFCGL